MNDQFPATKCLCAIMQASTERIRAMNPDDVARHFKIDGEWVRFCRDHEVQRRG